MARPSEITDDQMRDELVAAEKALDAGDYRAAVQGCVDAYLRLVTLRPDMIVLPRFPGGFSVGGPPQTGGGPGAGGPPGGGGGLAMGGPRPWPSDHGVRFEMPEGGKPNLSFSKDRFTLSEAGTYFEYTLDMVLRAQRHPAPTG